MTPLSLPKAAQRCGALGYPVFVLAPRSREPLAKSHGFKDATTDQEAIAALWREHPEGNIGFATDGLAVVDIDGPENSWPGPDRLAELHRAPWSATPGGGNHSIFRQPAGKAWRNSQSKIAPYVDIRANGGYIVAPPSQVHDGTGIYHWERQLVERDRLPLPPKWLSEVLDGLENPTEVDGVNPTEVQRPYRGTKTTSVELEALKRFIPAGPRQNDRLIFELARYVRGLELDRVGALNLFSAWHSRTRPEFLRRTRQKYQAQFLQAMDDVRIPCGTGPALSRAWAAAQVEGCAFSNLKSPRLRTLARLCFGLQRHHKAKPFFLSYRLAGRLLGIHYTQAGQLLSDLVRLKILEITTAGGLETMKAHRYRFLEDTSNA